MAIYAVGDIQGCFVTFMRLLMRIRFNPQHDRLWLTGDLVNRGPYSLEVLRWARSMRHVIVTVLGNHDLHFLAVAYGLRAPKRSDTFDALIEAPDARELIDYLRSQPLLYRHGRWLLVHAGLLPDWSLAEAQAQARELERRLAGTHPQRALAALMHTRRTARRMDGLRTALRAFTLMRYCDKDGAILDGYSGPPRSAPRRMIPWYQLPHRRRTHTTILCGHWAALGYVRHPGLISLDTGCVWGGALTALRLSDGSLFHEPLADPVETKKK
ncbi:MAG: symmetrical bis(5'-nucleosyl)-tetraphosphatase [Vicinamibacteria bacterium]|jgi:bis(5'-nucleosyl)-tetraphosphatase (symmetrical)|nr:symmetrical bis(5'-nucleosyl)-tetraphosphatase [Vicinamibacteria bacterium]